MSNEASAVNICTGVQYDPAAVVLVVQMGEADGNTFVIDLMTARAVDNMIESLKMARVAAFGLDVPSRQPLGFRHFRTG